MSRTYRPLRACAECGRTCRSTVSAVCRDCHYLAGGWDRNTPGGDDNALPEGHWAPQKGIQRWIPTEPVAEPVDLSKLTACATCSATVVEACRTLTGRRRTDHAGRLVPRACACGTPLAAGRRACAECVAYRQWQRQREWHTRQREAVAS